MLIEKETSKTTLQWFTITLVPSFFFPRWVGERYSLYFGGIKLKKMEIYLVEEMIHAIC